MFTAANVTTLADIAKIPVPVIWGAIEEKYNASTNPFRAAGVVKSDPLFQSRAAGEGSRTTVQSWNALPYATANISSDDPTEHSVPLKLTTRTWDAVRTHRNVSFSEMDLVVDLMGQDPLGNIAERVGAQFMPQDETARMFAILDGLVAADKADGSKITTTITDKVFDIQMLIAGLQKLGDAKASVKALGVSSATHALLAGQNVNGYVNPVAQTDIDFGTFAGKRLIVDDRFEDKVVGTKTLARIYGLGEDLFHVGRAPAKTPVEIERDASAGNGGGQSTVYFRWQDIIHPVGYSFSGTTAKQGGASEAELRTANKWTRISEKKNIPLIVIEAPLSI